jgi:hypothetical protein
VFHVVRKVKLIGKSIISTVLHWDNRDLDSRAAKIEKDLSKSPLKDSLNALKGYASKSIDDQEKIRAQSGKFKRVFT